MVGAEQEHLSGRMSVAIYLPLELDSEVHVFPGLAIRPPHVVIKEFHL